MEAAGDPLYREAQNWLVEVELGLAPPPERLPVKVAEAVKFISSESYRQAEERRKWLEEKPGES